MTTGTERIPEITRDEIRTRLHDPSFRILDVLPRVSFEEGHVPGAVSLPVAEVKERARALLPDLSQAIAVYCGSLT
jgi:rhodanese-related sulfurtransferase